jgi:hypothetical protein
MVRAFSLLRAVVRDRIELSTFRFSGMGIIAGQSMCRVPTCNLRASSVLDHYGLGEPSRVPMRGEVGQRRGYLSVTAIYGMQVALCGSG